MAVDRERLRVVVCGTVFGQVYLEAFRIGNYPIDLVGILAKGSPRAFACARYYGVPLYTSVEEIPDTVSIACVVIRSRILGGKGTEIAQAFLRRGIHVLQEHPAHLDEMAESLRLANAHGVLYRLNSFYVNVKSVRRLMGAVCELRRDQKILFVEATCGCQLLFSLLDIIGRSLGRLRPWDIKVLPRQSTDAFTTIEAFVGGVRVNLRVQNQLNPVDPDGYSYLMHQIAFGFAQGRLSLADTHGPLMWIPRPEFPSEVRSFNAAPQFASPLSDAPRLTIIGEAEAPTFEVAFRTSWPEGVMRALLDLRRAILLHEAQLRTNQYLLTLCELWRDVLTEIGPPELMQPEPWSRLSGERLTAINHAAAEMERMP